MRYKEPDSISPSPLHPTLFHPLTTLSPSPSRHTILPSPATILRGPFKFPCQPRRTENDTFSMRLPRFRFSSTISISLSNLHLSQRFFFLSSHSNRHPFNTLNLESYLTPELESYCNDSKVICLESKIF